MRRVVITIQIVGLLLPFSALSAERAPEPREILLKTIFALEMPGTIDLWKVDDSATAREIRSIRQALSKPQPEGTHTEPAFVVVGSGLNAIHEAHGVLVDGKKPRESISQDQVATIVFFSREFGRYVHLRRVEQRGNNIEVGYQFIPHKTKEVTGHFAIIPLGKLPAGKTRVEVKQTPMPQEYISAGWKPTSSEVAKGVVCSSFSFSVE